MIHVQSPGRPRRGFTLVELLIVITIIAVMAGASFLLLFGRRAQSDVVAARTQMVAVLREAQSRSMSQYQNVSWGVHFANTTNTAPFYALFSSAYSTATTAAYYRLPATVTYATSTLGLGSSTDIIFGGISGTASASTSIGLYSALGTTLPSTTISVASSGEVSF